VRDVEVRLTSRLVLEALLRTMAAELAARLQAEGCMGRELRLTLTLQNRTVREERMSLRRAVSGTAFLVDSLLRLSSEITTLWQPVTRIKATVDDIIPFAGHQLDLFVYHGGYRERLDAALDDLTARYGVEPFKWAVPLRVQAVLYIK
jgi:hypothetical protein